MTAGSMLQNGKSVKKNGLSSKGLMKNQKARPGQESVLDIDGTGRELLMLIQKFLTFQAIPVSLF